MEYCFIKDGRIESVWDGPELPDGAVELPPGAPVVVGSYADEYDEEWRRKTLAALVSIGRAVAPKGMKLDKEEFVPMTLKELIDTGNLILTPFETYDQKTESIREKVLPELVRDKIVERPRGLKLIDAADALGGVTLTPMTLEEALEQGDLSEREYAIRKRDEEVAAINARFAALDQARTRPLAAYALGRQTPEDTARLTEIEDEAARLRTRLAELQKNDSIEAQEEPVKG